MVTRSGHSEDRIDFNRRPEGQSGTADRYAAVPAFVSKRGRNQVGSAVDHGRMVDEFGGSVNESIQSDASLDAFQIAERSLGLRQDVDGAEAGRLLPMLDREVGAELAPDRNCALFHRQLSGHEQQLSRERKWRIIRGGRGRVRQRDAKFGQAAFDGLCHGVIGACGVRWKGLSGTVVAVNNAGIFRDSQEAKMRGLGIKANFFGLVLALAASPAGAAIAVPGFDIGSLAPHRAVYEMSLGDARGASGVNGLEGRMVFEFTGSSCEGYTLNMRLVTQVTDGQGESTLTDLRSSSWEQADGQKFSFNSTQYLNQKLNESTSGRAVRNASEAQGQVILAKPVKGHVKLPKGVLFPTQHSLALLSSARAGDRMLQARIYDGSDKGEKVYETTAFIGKPIAPGADKDIEPVAKASGLENLMSWPVSISYFEGKSSEEILPAYQLNFRLYSNGVSRKLTIDYGEFSIEGSLKSLEYLKADDCR